ncbi:hypothetical protein CF050_01120 [Clostridium botulinum]|uniref:hypothetical protein n=1 Tax=Clostridium botulinum TaxID=1491 RepID=UPI00196A126B|nr:hypothetical protein [Clostridium botulinum]MBN3345515.1 hypothetical protein [Clostridium botulinum]
MFGKNNPYDIERSIKRDKAFNILIQSDSLGSEIKSCCQVVKIIDELNQFDEINVIFSPTQNNELRKVIKKNYNSEIATYKLENKYIIFKSENFSEIIKVLLKECYEKQFNKVKNTNLDKIDLMTIQSDRFDLIVLGEEDIKQLEPNNKLICKNDVLEKVRLYMINQKLFYIKKAYSIDETFYYIYRYNKVFPYFRYLYIVLCERKSGIKNDKLFEYANSLSTRLEFYCRACDQTKIECLRTPNNLTKSYIKYNFGYLIIIMTGIYDNLAWIINDIYKLNIRREDICMKIPIKLLKKCKKNSFLEKLSLKDKKLAEFISNDLTQKCIHLIYPIRDSLVHRNFFDSVFYCNKCKGRKNNLIKVPKIVYDIFKGIYIFNSNYLDSFIISNGVYIEPYKFIQFLDEIFVSKVNEILNRINLNSLINELSQEERERIKQCFKKYESGLYKFLDLDFKPIYF